MKSQSKPQRWDEWDEISYPELSAEENKLIRRARRAGFANMYPAFPNAEMQAKRTLAGAKKFLAERIGK